MKVTIYESDDPWKWRSMKVTIHEGDDPCDPWKHLTIHESDDPWKWQSTTEMLVEIKKNCYINPQVLWENRTIFQTSQAKCPPIPDQIYPKTMHMEEETKEKSQKFIARKSTELKLRMVSIILIDNNRKTE